MVTFPSSFWTWIKTLRIQLQKKSPLFDKLSGSKQKRQSLKGRKLFFWATFSLPWSTSLLFLNGVVIWLHFPLDATPTVIGGLRIACSWIYSKVYLEFPSGNKCRFLFHPKFRKFRLVDQMERTNSVSAYKNNNQTCGVLGRVCATGYTVPPGTLTWNFRNFKPEFLLNGKRPKFWYHWS